MITWWFTQAIRHYDPDLWWHPFRTFSIGTCIFQWGLLILLLLALNRPIRRLLFESGINVRGTGDIPSGAGTTGGTGPAPDGGERGKDS